MRQDLEKPELTFNRDENDDDHKGIWSVRYGGYRFAFSTDHDTDEPYIYIDREKGGDGDSMILYKNGNIKLGAYGIETSFHDLHRCIEIRDAIRLLKNGV